MVILRKVKSAMNEFTLVEVGKVFGVTRERIRQAEATALSKLRHPTRNQVVRDYYNHIREDHNLNEWILAEGCSRKPSHTPLDFDVFWDFGGQE